MHSRPFSSQREREREREMVSVSVCAPFRGIVGNVIECTVSMQPMRLKLVTNVSQSHLSFIRHVPMEVRAMTSCLLRSGVCRWTKRNMGIQVYDRLRVCVVTSSKDVHKTQANRRSSNGHGSVRFLCLQPKPN